MAQSNYPKMPDRLSDRLATYGRQLSPALRKVSDYIDTHREAVMGMSATELGIAIGTSDATVIRTVQALGFDGLKELKHELAASIGHGSSPADNLYRTLAVIEDVDAAVSVVLEAHMEAMAAMRGEALAPMRESVRVLAETTSIAFYGIGPSAPLAEYARLAFARTGRHSVLLDACGSELADQLLGLKRADALVMLAYGEAYPEAEATLSEARRLRIPVVLISDSLSQHLARKATIRIPIPRGRAGNVALHGATLVCIEALLLGVSAKDSPRTMATLGHLNDLRHSVRGRKRGA